MQCLQPPSLKHNRRPRPRVRTGCGIAAARTGAFLAALAMAGCSTPEYRVARDTCTAQWLQKMPPEYETRETTLVRHEDVPDGTETCTTERIRDASDPNRVVHTMKRTCTPNTKRVEVPYLALETVDIRKSARDAGIRACTARFCLASHGNVSCGSEE